MPHLPDDLDGRRESFNAALVESAKKLPETDPGIQTRQYFAYYYLDVVIVLMKDKWTSKSHQKSKYVSIRLLIKSTNYH